MILEHILGIFLVLLIFFHIAWIILLLKTKTYNKNFTPVVSVIIPAHNEEKTILKCFQSIIKSRYPKIKEIIIVNDGSTDGTESVLKSIKDKRLILLKTKHVGKAKAINTALKKANCDYVVILDADSIVDKNAIISLMGPLKKDKIAASTGIIRGIKTSNPLTWFQDFEYMLSSGFRLASSNYKGNVILPGFMAAKKNLIKNSFSSDTMSEDFDIGLVLRKKGYETIVVSDAVIHVDLPKSVKRLLKQRLRWGIGTLQGMKKHKKFILSKESGTIGRFSVPMQFYWYVHASVYLPIMLFMIYHWYNYFFFSKVVITDVILYILSITTIYGVFNLIYNIFIAHFYSLTLLSAASIVLYFISLFYVALLIKIIGEKKPSHIFSHVFFFLYSILVFIPLAVSIILYKIKKSGNVWIK